MEQQRIDQRAIRRAGSGVDHHTDGLVDDNELVVLIEDVERDIFGMGFGILGGWGKKNDCLARL
ncbi:hypothetical protein D3C72_2466160 [compost metagenome]